MNVFIFSRIHSPVKYPLCWIVCLYPLIMFLFVLDVANIISSCFHLWDSFLVSLIRKNPQKTPLFWCNQITPFLDLMTDSFWALLKFSPKLSWQLYSPKLFYTDFIILSSICSFLNHLEFIFLYLIKQESGFIFYFSINTKQIFLTSCIS